MSNDSAFYDWLQNNPNVKAWKDQFYKEYGEYPDINSGGYDYRGAFEAGIVPEPSQYDLSKTGEPRYHWESLGINGKDLKSKNHPTRWKSDYMKKTGIDPDSAGISKDSALKVINAPWVRYGSKSAGAEIKDPNILKGLAPVGPWMLYKRNQDQNKKE